MTPCVTFSNEGNQRHSAVSSLLRLMVVQALLLALPADFQRYPNYDVPYITSGIDRLYNPMYSAPPPPPPSVPYGSTTYYGSSIYGVQATQRPVYPQNYSPATPSNCLSYYCYRSALPSLDVITNATAPAVEPVCGKRNYLICAADKPVSTEYSAPSSPYQYQQYQKSNVCPAYFCKLVPRTTPVLVAADSCDSFECNIIEWRNVAMSVYKIVDIVYTKTETWCSNSDLFICCYHFVCVHFCMVIYLATATDQIL